MECTIKNYGIRDDIMEKIHHHNKESSFVLKYIHWLKETYPEIWDLKHKILTCIFISGVVLLLVKKFFQFFH